MSAIFGMFHSEGSHVGASLLLKMEQKITRSEGDREDICLEDRIGLGVSLNRSEAYFPNDASVYSDEGRGIKLVCDALIWNRAELLGKLCLDDGVSTQGLLAAAYKEWSEDCPKMINGDFVFAVFDKQKNVLFIARDHLGVRPLYYFFDGAIFAFATDCSALLALPFVGKQLDEITLYAKLSNTYHIDPEATSYEHIKRLPQAHTLSVDDTGLRKNRYWIPGASGKIVCATEEEYARRLYALVDDAVRIRVNGVAGKIGAELSGGLDSSVVTVLANQSLKSTGRHMGVLFSWSPSWTIQEKRPSDEREHIEAICRQEGLSCTYFDPTDALYARLDGIPAPEALRGGTMLAREAVFMSSRGVKYILSGFGGDEAASLRAGLYQILLQGYPDYFLKQARWLSKGSAVRFVKVLVTNTVLQWFKPYSYFGKPNKNVPDILKNEFRKKTKKQCKKDIVYYSVDAIKHIQTGSIQARTDLSALLDAEYDIRHLYPLLDYRVVDFALSIPRCAYYKNGINRYVFRKAFASILPPVFDDNFSKDDPAKAEFFAKNLNADKLKQTASLIDRDIFDPYVDWNKLGKVVETFQPQNNLGPFIIMQDKIFSCLNIGRALREAND